MIEIGGSSNLSYIENKHDIDVFVIFKDNTNRKEKMHKIFNLIRTLKDINVNVSVLARTSEIHRHYVDETYQTETQKQNLLRFPVYAYLFKDIDIVCGEDTSNIKSVDILQEPFKSRYIQALKDFLVEDTHIFTTAGYHSKRLYHVLTGLYIIKNNSYDLTEEQVANINLLHDWQFPEELVTWIYDEVNKL